MLNINQNKPVKIVVVGASPDRLNSNTVLRRYVEEGFQILLGSTQVVSTEIDFAYRQVLEFKPDLILAFGSCMPDSSYYISLRDYCDKNKVPFYFWLHDDPYEFDIYRKIAIYADHIFTNDRFSSLHYPHLSSEKRVTHLPLAASKEFHFLSIRNESQMEYDLFFCGVAFENRIQMIRDLEPILKRYRTLIVGPGWHSVGLHFCSGDILSKTDFVRLANRSRFVLNMGRHSSLANDQYQLTASTPGPRTFEVAMAGGLQLFFTEGLEILDYYSAGKEIFLFDSKAEIDLLLSTHDSKEQELARGRSQQRTLRDHTYANRVQVILNQFQSDRAGEL